MRRFSIVPLFIALILNNESVARSLNYQKNILPLLEVYCLDCHSNDKAEADVNFDNFRTIQDIKKDPKVWIKVDRMLSSRQMPPRDSDQPSKNDREVLSEWVQSFLMDEAKARAGDPGRVVLRRLSNDEYNYTVRDLTGVNSLDPTREFPVDGAAGEGFTNSGDAQGMSPALATKYLDAGKEIANHVVLTPKGIRFSPFKTERDRTDELLSRIQEFYRQFTEDGGGSSVNLQGIKFTTNQGGRLPLSRYLNATLSERRALISGIKTIDSLAEERGLNAKYLKLLWDTLSADNKDQGSVLNELRKRWKSTKSNDSSELVSYIEKEQKRFWKFNTIGHIDSEGRTPPWMEMVGVKNLVTTRYDLKWKLPDVVGEGDIVFYLIVNDADDGNENDYVVWKNLRLEGGGHTPMKLWELEALQGRIDKQRLKMLGFTARYLEAAIAVKTESDITKLSSAYNINAETLKIWLDYLAIGRASAVKVEGHLNKRVNIRDGINGFAADSPDSLPSIIANSSDKDERIPGLAKANSLVVHPTPSHFSAIGWQSPIEGEVKLEAHVIDAHSTCGNGIEWLLQHRVSDKTSVLWQGEYGPGGSAKMPPKKISVKKGEVLSLVVGPRDNNHSCDLTSVQLVVTETNGTKHVWDLVKEVSPNLQAGNPHEDSYGNSKVWHFFRGEMAKVDRVGTSIVTVPKGSVLEAFLAEKDPEKRKGLALQVQALATGELLKDSDSPDFLLQRQLHSFRIPINLPNLLKDLKAGDQFGYHPLGHTTDVSNLIVKAPDIIEFRIPAQLAKGRELVGTVELDSDFGMEGSVKVDVGSSKSGASNTPILVREGSSTHERVESQFRSFVDLFPAALCYAKIVPVDEVVTLTLFHREDDHLRRLMLDDNQADELDQLWDELSYVAQEPLKYQVAFEQIREFATQDRPDLVKRWAPHVDSINRRADDFRDLMTDTEPIHVNAIIDFAHRCWRRPLTVSEVQNLRNLYGRLRNDGIIHEQSIRLMIASVLTSPSFLYRREISGPDKDPVNLSAYEMATRLSYFLWSSGPDKELLAAANNGSLNQISVLHDQTRRMLKDPKIIRMAEQFACQWFHINDFDKNDDKNEKLFPQFEKLRSSMYKESLLFFEDMFRNNGSILDFIKADYVFLDRPLAEHYGEDIFNLWDAHKIKGNGWKRIEGARLHGRGGILGMSTFLSVNSGASRTSPILRGNWIYETLLGQKLPKPPLNVPDLPEVIPDNLTARQLIEKHSSSKECAKCHERIDPYGFALEQYDAIGRKRKSLMDASTVLYDGTKIDGIKGLQHYIVSQRLDDFLEQFCRKILGYSLGREVQLSDIPLIEQMKNNLKKSDYRFHELVQQVVSSNQFRKIRGRLFEIED